MRDIGLLNSARDTAIKVGTNFVMQQVKQCVLGLGQARALGPLG